MVLTWYAYFCLKTLHLFIVIGNVSFMVATGLEDQNSVS